MKSGKFVRLNKENNIAISYGSVDTKNMKSIYIRLNAWVEPMEDNECWNRTVGRMRREVKQCVLNNIDRTLFKENFIVDLDLRSSGILLNKRSFLNCEITLYTNQSMDIKSEEFSSIIRSFSKDVIQCSPTLLNCFNIYSTKH